ncbi:MAG TPA: hypothetical protein VEU30_02735 [Thermoanaerobaculia bacterium]|nr:hypothetical protein [Thermoanaerobaculia bacterium]
MNPTATPIGSRYSERETDIGSLTYTDGMLRIEIDTLSSEGLEVCLEIEFTGPRGFRLLDEGDLLPYWEAGVFAGGYHLFEITAGGWRAQETQLGMLPVSDALDSNEYFVATTNTCLNVLAASPPRIDERPR